MFIHLQKTKQINFPHFFGLKMKKKKKVQHLFYGYEIHVFESSPETLDKRRIIYILTAHKTNFTKGSKFRFLLNIKLTFSFFHPST